MIFDIFSPAFLAKFWSAPAVNTNLIVFANLFGALILGLIVGYERSYHGRAAGMRTYALVCMASCAVTVVAGFPGSWYGGSVAHVMPDPTRVIQGVLTGVGFLGAGIITKDGANISGLTTAASIWSSSAIGILVGVGFYPAAILLTILSTVLMMWASYLERWLPSKASIAVTLRFKPGFVPIEEILQQAAENRGYIISTDSLQIKMINGCHEWHYLATTKDKVQSVRISKLSEELSKFDGVEEFKLTHARN